MKTRIEVKVWANVYESHRPTIYHTVDDAIAGAELLNSTIARAVPLTGFYELEREPLKQESSMELPHEITGVGLIVPLPIERKFLGKKVTIVVTEME